MADLKVVNEESPIKLVLLGGPGVGKSTFANNLYSRFFRETYYPTHKSTILLFEYLAKTKKARTILDEYGGLEGKKLITQGNDIQLSPTIFQSYTRGTVEVKKRRSSSSGTGSKLIKNQYYSYKFPDSKTTSAISEDTYTTPQTSPVLIELIDTTPFKPELVVPFLEVSLYRNLDKEDLYNLANEPRRPVSTNPLLVASGASELDGNVNGYIFMYSAVPSLNPPSYDDVLSPSTSRNSAVSETSSNGSANGAEDPLTLLEIMRGAILDAWREYRNYQKKWKKGSEGDVFSLVYGIKQLWKMKSYEEEQQKLAELRKISSILDDIDLDPSSSDSPPPILIVCTHAEHVGRSPKLIEAGKKLANDWKSSFILVENENRDNVEESVALLIREIVERRKLQKLRKKLGK